MDTFLRDEDLWALSITVKGRCNCSCSYCHFYSHRDRKEFSIDSSDELYDNYLKLINEIKGNLHKNIQVRFSEGEPLVLGNKIFELSNKMYEITGIEPYVLTNGRLLNKDIIEKSKKNHISAFLVSIENPFDEADGAPKTKEVLKLIKELDSEEVRVLPAIMIIKNNMFKNLLNIADYVYNEIGLLPSFAELTYQAYESPTDEELGELYTNIMIKHL
ncbi:MAG: radical SAM protein [Clostridiaceae bacterium]|nr:radical SAM protein [Clostridiaceae bacterium]